MSRGMPGAEIPWETRCSAGLHGLLRQATRNEPGFPISLWYRNRPDEFSFWPCGEEFEAGW